eukprot:1152015-Pelagomonas_calceolata.AAC.12
MRFSHSSAQGHCSYSSSSHDAAESKATLHAFHTAQHEANVCVPRLLMMRFSHSSARGPENEANVRFALDRWGHWLQLEPVAVPGISAQPGLVGTDPATGEHLPFFAPCAWFCWPGFFCASVIIVSGSA